MLEVQYLRHLSKPCQWRARMEGNMKLSFLQSKLETITLIDEFLRSSTMPQTLQYWRDMHIHWWMLLSVATAEEICTSIDECFCQLLQLKRYAYPLMNASVSCYSWRDMHIHWWMLLSVATAEEICTSIDECFCQLLQLNRYAHPLMNASVSCYNCKDCA